MKKRKAKDKTLSEGEGNIKVPKPSKLRKKAPKKTPKGKAGKNTTKKRGRKFLVKSSGISLIKTAIGK